MYRGVRQSIRKFPEREPRTATTMRVDARRTLIGTPNASETIDGVVQVSVIKRTNLLKRKKSGSNA